MRQEKLTDIPASEVADIKESFEKDGASEVTATEQADGKFTIIATFPD